MNVFKILFLLGLWVLRAEAQEQCHFQSSDKTEVYLLIVSPSTVLFNTFGHVGLWIKDPQALEQTQVYNFGAYHYQSQTLIQDFLKQKLQFWLAVRTFKETRENYRREKRKILALKLNLTEFEIERLKAQLLQRLSQDRYYLYDWYAQNCSTQIRDLLDKVLDGKIHSQTQTLAPWTLREVLGAHLEYWPVLWTFIHAFLGLHVDRRLTLWESMFLPALMKEIVQNLKIEGRPLVSSACLLEHQGVRDFPDHRTHLTLKRGICIGSLMFLSAILFYLGMIYGPWHQRFWHGLAGVILVFWGLASTVLGMVSLFLWWIVPIWAFNDNLNLLIFGPWDLALVFLGISWIRGKSLNPHPSLFWIDLRCSSVVLGWGLLFFNVQDNWDLMGLSFFPWLWLCLWKHLKFFKR